MASASFGRTTVESPRRAPDSLIGRAIARIPMATAVSCVASCCCSRRRRRRPPSVPGAANQPPSSPLPLVAPLTAIYYVQFVYPFREGDFQIRHVQDAPISADTCASRPPVRRFQTFLLDIPLSTGGRIDGRMDGQTDGRRTRPQAYLGIRVRLPRTRVSRIYRISR